IQRRPRRSGPRPRREVHRTGLVAHAVLLVACGVTTISWFKRIFSRPMSVASPVRARTTSRHAWVPVTAAWTVGTIATLSLIASVSPQVRWLIRAPREFVNNYLFNFPDTSFAWAFVL